jgi:hypothetical protein
MKIDLTEVNKIWINLAEDTSKKESMLEQFNSYEMNNHIRFDGIKNENSVLGCGLSMYGALHYAKQNLPCLILEDDARIMDEFFHNEIEVPDETDAIYLGISHWGMTEGKEASTLNGIGREVINENLFRIYSMCSLHAVLYITEKYVNAAMEAVKQRNDLNTNPDYVGNAGHVDIGTALIQKDFFVVAPTNPYFYQDCPRNKRFTSIPLNYSIGIKQ